MRRVIAGSLLLAGTVCLTPAAPLGAQGLPADFFEGRIRPVLATRCCGCHSSTLAAPKGELVLDTKAGVLNAGRDIRLTDVFGPVVKDILA